jgi:hypothetical protein
MTVQMLIDARDLQRIDAAYSRAPAAVERAVGRRMAGLLLELQSDVQELTPTAFGALRASVGTDIDVRPGLGVTGIVGTSLAHAIPVELGTRPHMPPVAPIKLWAEKKLGLTGREAQRAAWAIAMTIKRRGTLGVGMFHRTFARRRSDVSGALNLAVIEGIQAAFGGEA